MDITQMRYFREVARTGSISKAAKILGISQPPLSRAMMALQKEVGTQLLKRTAHGVTLTVTGEQFYEAVDKLIYLAETTINRFTGLGSDIEGSVRIACVEDIMTPRLADSINSFIDLYPKIRIDFVCGEPAYVRSLVKDNMADIAISNYSDKEEGLQYIDSGLFRKMGVVVPNGSKYARVKTLDMNEIKKMKLFAPRKDAMSAVLKDIKDVYDELNIYATYDTPLNYLRFIRGNGRYMLCFEIDEILLRSRNLAFCPIEPEILINVGIIYNDDLSSNSPAMLLIKHILQAMESNKTHHN